MNYFALASSLRIIAVPGLLHTSVERSTMTGFSRSSYSCIRKKRIKRWMDVNDECWRRFCWRISSSQREAPTALVSGDLWLYPWPGQGQDPLPGSVFFFPNGSFLEGKRFTLHFSDQSFWGSHFQLTGLWSAQSIVPPWWRGRRDGPQRTLPVLAVNGTAVECLVAMDKQVDDCGDLWGPVGTLFMRMAMKPSTVQANFLLFPPSYPQVVKLCTEPPPASVHGDPTHRKEGDGEAWRPADYQLLAGENMVKTMCWWIAN